MFVVRVAPGLASLIAVALSAERPVMLEPRQQAGLRLLDHRGPRVSGEPA
jgi:hypothetical protein